MSAWRVGGGEPASQPQSLLAQTTQRGARPHPRGRHPRKPPRVPSCTLRDSPGKGYPLLALQPPSTNSPTHPRQARGDPPPHPPPAEREPQPEAPGVRYDLGPGKGVRVRARWPPRPAPRGSSARPAQALPGPYLLAVGWPGTIAPRPLPWTSPAAATCPWQPLRRGLQLHRRSQRCAPSGCAGCTGALSGPLCRTRSARVRMRTRPPTLRDVLTLPGLAAPDPPALPRASLLSPHACARARRDRTCYALARSLAASLPPPPARETLGLV